MIGIHLQIYAVNINNLLHDRGWIFSRTARTVEVSKFFIIWHCTFVKNGRKGHARAKYKVRNSLQKKAIVKNVLWLVKLLYSTFYIEY